MPESICATCSRPPGAGMVLCPWCGDRMADHLHRVADLLAELDITRARADVLSVTAGRGGEQGLPFGQVAATARARLISVIEGWVGYLARTRAVPWSVPAMVDEAALWLVYRLDWLRALPEAGDAYCDLDRAMDQAWHAVDRPINRAMFRVGPCPELRAGAHCPGEVWAYIPVRLDTEVAVLRCRHPECPRHVQPWPPQQWRDAGLRILRRQMAVSRGSGDHQSCRRAHRST
jgi:hypothetical protein